jgi:hypothetical protein
MSEVNRRVLSMERGPQNGVGELPPAWRSSFDFATNYDMERLSVSAYRMEFLSWQRLRRRR